MTEQMDFLDNFLDFIRKYSFKDEKEIYTNGADLIPVFRVEQAWDHYTDVILDYIYNVESLLDDADRINFGINNYIQKMKREI